jgi:7-cyano-7-deazaguanine synthase
VPGRNLFFFTAAGALAYSLGITHIVAGVCQTDYSGYPDCREPFVRAAEQALSLAMDRPFTVHTPLMHLDKAQTWLLAQDLGGLDLVIEQSHTCYAGDRITRHAWGYGCGQCAACQLRARGYQQAFN